MDGYKIAKNKNHCIDKERFISTVIFPLVNPKLIWGSSIALFKQACKICFIWNSDDFAYFAIS